MNTARALNSPPTGGIAPDNMVGSNELSEEHYDSPLLIDLGHVRDLTLGNSSSGNADANSQYYW